jgi:stage II sporulation protein D
MRKTLGQNLCTAAAILLLSLGAVAILFSSCMPRAARPRRISLLPPEADIRLPNRVSVDIAHSRPEFTVTATGPGRWLNADGVPVTGTSDGPWQLASRNGRLLLDGKPHDTEVLELRVEDGLFGIGSREYRGHLRVTALEDGRFIVRNDVATEDYLRSVVGREVYTSWHEQALLAQAVTARTYLIYALGGRDHLSRADMAYHGVGEEHPATDEAVRQTTGIIISYGGKILPAYFQSTCGGHTMPVEDFTDRLMPMEPLRGVDCNYCAISPQYRWDTRVPSRQVAAGLRASGLLSVDRVHSLVPTGRGVDGYATEIVVNGADPVGAYAFRGAVNRAMGGAVLKSVNFEVEKTGDAFLFQGAGYGHGVGLCQWGAEGMARAGHHWTEIIAHYYPGARLREVEGIQNSEFRRQN